MKTVLFICAIITIITPALAQQAQQQVQGPPSADAQIQVYRQLLDAANAQLASAVANAGARIDTLTKQVSDLKAKCGKPCEDEMKKPNTTK